MIELNDYNRALQISKKSIENVFNSIQRAILRVDLSGAIKTINNNAIELLGLMKMI
ncbi:hypothetical protein JTS93_03880 [Clostridium botulinum]|nr:hypothetical protein [Clostridium botulinum]